MHFATPALIIAELLSIQLGIPLLASHHVSNLNTEVCIGNRSLVRLPTLFNFTTMQTERGREDLGRMAFRVDRSVRNWALEATSRIVSQMATVNSTMY